MIGNGIKISVIIPMYNSKQYIFHCIDGLKKQTLKDIEIILIDDCSTDGSYKLCMEKYAKDDNVRVIKQPKNMGPGAARNEGIRTARGEYISFVDSDDAIVTDAYYEMYKAASDNDADVLHIGASLIPFCKPVPDDLLSLGRDKYISFLLDSEEIEGIRVLPKNTGERIDEWLLHYHHWNIWSKLYRRDFLLDKSIEFVDLSMSEDQIFSFKCLIHADNYVKMPGFYYIYRIETESLSRGKRNIAFTAKILRTLFGISDYIDRTMDSHSFFDGNDIYRQKVRAYCCSFLENGYLNKCYKEVGRKAMEEDETIKEIFKKSFGSNADYVSKLFYDAHDAVAAAGLQREPRDINSYDFWKKMVDKYGAGNVIRF